MDDDKKEKKSWLWMWLSTYIAWRVLGSVPMTMKTLPASLNELLCGFRLGGSEVKNRKQWLESIIGNLCCWIGHGLLLASLANVGVIS